MYAAGGGLPAAESARCPRARTRGDACDRCLAACPADCIRIAPATLEIGADCLGCGACHAVCPTGALRDASFDDVALAAEAGKLATPRFHCSRAAPERESVGVHCLARLSAAVFVELARRGAHEIELVSGDCDRCAARQAREVAAAEVQKTAVECFTGLGLTAPRLRTHSIPAAADERAACSRRAFFTRLGRKRRARARGAASELRAVLGACGAGPIVVHDAPFGRPVLQGTCDGCAACVQICPTEALAARTGMDRFELVRLGGRCSGCGLCARICPPGALRVDPVWEATDAVELLAAPRIAHCAGCGARVPHGCDRCAACRRRHATA